MIVGYVRVSTVEQNEERQILALQENAKADKVFLDKLSGKDTNRPQFQAMLDYVREGDTVVVSEYNRLARSTKDLLETIELLNAKGVTVKSLKENLDTSTPQGKFMLTVFSGLAEFERALLLQRQKEGIAVAKANGVYKGRTKTQKPDNWQDLVTQYRQRKISVAELSKQTNTSRPTVYKWLKETE